MPPQRKTLHVSGSTESIGALDILAQIKVDFYESKSILQETSRSRGSFFSAFTASRSKAGDGAKNLEKTISDIIVKLNGLTARTDIPLDRLPNEGKLKAIISMRQIEKKLRDNIIAELKARMINKKYIVDYGELSKQALSICAEATEIYETAHFTEAAFISRYWTNAAYGVAPMQDSYTPPRNRHEFKIAILCALPLEASGLRGLFDVHWNAEKYGKEQMDTNAYTLGVIGSHNVVLVHMPYMGKVAATAAATNLRASFRGIQLALVVGICGGAPFGPSGEVLLGDVVISEGLVQYDLGRRWPNTFVRKDTTRENLPRPRPEVCAILAKLQTVQSRQQLQNEMLEHLQLLRQRPGLTIPYPGSMNDRLFKPNYLHRHRLPSECATCSNVDGGDLCRSAMEANCEELGCRKLDPRRGSRTVHTSDEPKPNVHFGLVATGDTVMRSGEDRDSIAARDKVIAFEMEGAGVWEIFPAALVIKGVCDYADSHKNKTWQDYAAATAAAAAKAFLEHWDISLPQNAQDNSVEVPKTRRFDTTQLEIMKRLNTSPYRDRKDRNPDRVAGTCEWFIQHFCFHEWKDSTAPRLLWVSADPGCGKSVLAKYLVDSILLATTKRTVCYFFFKDDVEDQKSIISALSCILHQIFQQNPHLLSESIVNQIEAGGERFLDSFSNLWYILLTAAQDVHDGEIICIFDAIDECEEHGRSQLAKKLCKLYGPESLLNLKLKFLITSRPLGNIRRAFQPLQNSGMPIIHLSGESDQEMEKIAAEIDIYIKARVEGIGERSKLNPDEQQTLLDRLTEVPNRTYLWVYLILDLIESDINIDRSKILRATARIPKTIDEAYSRILSKSYDRHEAKRILHIVVAAKRALSLRELGFALSIKSHHRSYNDIDIKSEDRLKESIRETCGLFVTIIHSRVYLLHQTAKEFLVQDAMSLSTANIKPKLKWKHTLLPRESHKILAEICISYLLLKDAYNWPNSNNELSQSTNNRVLFDYSANYWAMHLRESHLEINEFMRQSILRICDVHTRTCKKWLRAFWKKNEHIIFPKRFTTLMVLSYFGLGAVVKMKLSTMTNDIDLNARDKTYKRSALSWAAGNGFDDVVKLLAQGHRTWRRQFTLLLFGNASEINSMDKSGRTPLLYAIWNGNVAVVKRLLEAGARIDVTDSLGGTPFFYAMSYRRKAIVELLLKHGATPESEHTMITRLFFSAVEKGDLQVVKLFLDSNFDIESKGRGNQTPLPFAMEMGHIDIVRALLDRGAKIKVEGGRERMQLHLAVIHGDFDLVQFFLENGADINAVNSKNRTALSYALESENGQIIRLLERKGADSRLLTEREKQSLSRRLRPPSVWRTLASTIRASRGSYSRG
ncbi:hypothetical protein Trihar35433_7646 [Trichoderma harzianum]|nr:hypothetical protein Trihar35433_7646 [Trichoderma harzianum]